MVIFECDARTGSKTKMVIWRVVNVQFTCNTGYIKDSCYVVACVCE